MAVIISIASGKGGVGKSVVASNLGLLFARAGRRVILVDLDIGGANLHILFGLLNPSPTLTDFLHRRVESLDRVAQPVKWGAGLRLIPGTGETLASANVPYSRKQRLIRHLRQMDADVVVLDCPPGTSYQALDFFLLGDWSLAVATPDPTSVIELYRFLKLSAIRKVLLSLMVREREEVRESLMEREFSSVEEVLDAIGDKYDKPRVIAEQALKSFNPFLILNRLSSASKISTAYLQEVVMKFVGSELVVLGEIPQDEQVEESVRSFHPVIDMARDCRASLAIRQTFHALEQRVCAASLNGS